ncbi:ATP-binding cassette domain-containing protein [Staphylococcus capitis]|nr:MULTISPECIES: ATP-binding cassette domain-containing protein [Staphylococcus]MCC9117622.1 ATP-binding cassette domain-containing protein [Staphylococcus capitis]MCC9143928.1 ATP-binding cassette domain-containing protein [Staphylococcus capitis]MCI2768099.1 ATP-binding cassette domain-containing protein [Staphylococcus warneri]MCI2787800.1 ATP-binding cassette domain-containing protein [Staphylococcus warneri]
MLTLANVSFNKKKQKILQNINYSFKENKIYGLLGPNGSGKTTLFKSILGVINYTGEIYKSSNKLGHLIDYPAFYANLTCLENLKLHANYIDVHYDDLEKYLSLVNLEDAKNKKFKNLSMGMKQRLGISKTLVGNSDIVLLDEPTNGLDPMGIMDIRNIILNEVKSKHRITIVSSHILKELTEFTDIYLFIKNGKIIAHLKNSDGYYGLLKIKSDDIYKDFNFSFEYSIIQTSKENYILGSYNDLVKLDKKVKKNNLEDIYLNIMNLDIEEVFLK